MHTLPNTFARRDLSIEEADFAVLGIPYDSSESYRTGSRFAPNSIREASRDLEDYDMEEGFDLLDLRICDLGDLEVSFGNIEETKNRARDTISHILGCNAAPILLGGEHTVTYFAAEAMKKDTFYVLYDAHLDYRGDYLGNRFSHASVTRRVAEVVGPENIAVVGVRSAQKEELEDAQRDGIEFISSADIQKKKEGVIRRLLELTKGRDVYFSIDFDVVDPAEAPGVCNPEPGGVSYRTFVESLSFLKDCKLVGLDLCELTPQYDAYSQILAAKLLFKTLAIYKG